MEKRNTRELILERALELFSVKGYQGVTVKEIARAVGIKDSSLYKHFIGKQEIYDTLLGRMNEKFEETVAFYHLPQGDISEVAKEYGRGNLVWLKRACEAVFLFFLKDPQASKFRKMLIIEQYQNKDAAQTLHSWFLDNAMAFQTSLFAEMMRQGYYREGPPQAVALQFYAPFFMLLCQYDTLPGKESEALGLLMEHIEQFASVYQIRKEEAL
jgi:AcrR family transcriptional regulator